MIAPEKWWGILESYNISIFPMQFVMLIIAILVTIFLFAKPGTKTNILMKAYLAFCFAWISIVFFLILGKGLPSRYLQAFLFISISILFLIDIFTRKIEFKMPEASWQKYVTILLVICSFSYPLVGMMVGHYYPKMIIAGAYPCPTTALALALLAAALPKVDKKVFVLLLIWAIPFPILIQIPKFGAYEDSIMLSIGVYSLIMFIRNWKAIGNEKSTTG